jgi:SecD/SecF fusion protein
MMVILAVLLAALWAIFPSPSRLLDPKLSFAEKNALRPGIDMVGGTSLLYEIKAPEGTASNQNLAEQVMESLKKRVDPDGVRNLIWRPQGNTRLEIQMPLTGKNENSHEKRAAFEAAQEALSGTNTRASAVIDAVQRLTGEARTAELNRLAQDSAARHALFAKLAQTWDEIQSIKAAHDPAKAGLQADKEDEYEKLKSQIDQTNLSVSELESVLDSYSDAKKRDLALQGVKNRFVGFPSRQAAIDQFVKAYADYSQVKSSIDDAGDLKRLLKGSGVLEFHIQVLEMNSPQAVAMRERLMKRGPRVEANDTMRWYQVDRPEEFRGQTVQYNNKSYILLYTTPDKQMVNGPGVPHWALERAFPEPDEYGRRVAGFRFDPQGAKLFSDLTRNNIKQHLAIVLDDKVISAPQINSQISRQGTISGGEKGFSQADLNYLISTLNAGSLPAQLAEEPISERTVGPQLGADNLRAGLRACMIGLVVVCVFMVCYYYLSGVVAVIALLMNLVLILGVMCMLNATFTLPGVAGIALTIGAAVDANVLIFERLREEQHRGLSLRMALRNAYASASHAILDSNATTVITSLVLVWLGSEEVRGFGITLLIGLVSSLFTALFVTRTIFGILMDKFGVTSLSSLPLTFPAYDRFLKPDIQWMNKIGYFLVLSAVLLSVGLGSFIHYYNKGQMLDIEFASGTSVQFELKEPMHIDAVRKAIVAAGEEVLPSPSVVSVGTDDKTYEVVTPNPDAPAVRSAVLATFGKKLNIEQPSHFTSEGGTLDQAMSAGVVVPIKTDTTQVGNFTPPSLGLYRGGAAIILKDLSPPLSAEEIRARLGRQRLQAQVGESAGYHDFIVESDGGKNKPVTSAVVMVNDENIPFERDEGKWREDVAAPMWKLVNEAITKPAQLQKVSNFDAQVAGDATRDALMALTLSLVIILAYIWLRFGNLKFGIATVLAMVHDTLLAVGAVGLAHLSVQYVPWLASHLLLEPFRLNLTMVAGILTIMSYSMIDTIVVFDRIRENRGKFGHLDRKIINDSINQTLSRTLLTAGTTVATVAVMYITGGAGIHGFTFVLLLGILVGTYSSIAVAAPILLMGARQPQEATQRRPVGRLQRA